jgi:hypothetical protein
MTFSEPATDIFAALAQAQGEIDNAKKDAKNPAFNKNYADLASVLDVAKAPLAKSGLALTFDTASSDNHVTLTPCLVHKTGQWIRFEPFAIRLNKSDAQGQGSGLTYGRRYLIQTILGIAAEDDDGNAASQPPASKKPAPGPAPNPSPTLREQTIALITENKDRLTAEQLSELKTDVQHAGTTPALLNGVVEKMNRMIEVKA